MPQLQALPALIERCRERGDMPSPDQFVTDAELGRYIQKSYERLYNKCVAKYEDYFLKFANETNILAYPTGGSGIVPGTKHYSFPADMWKLKRLCLGGGSSTRVAGQPPPLVELQPCTIHEEMIINPTQTRSRPTHYVSHGRNDYTDTQTGSGFMLCPIPDQVYLVDIVYVPTPPIIPTEAPPVGVDFFAGWDEWVVLDVARKMRSKQESEIADLMLEMKELWEETIQPAMINRNDGLPRHVQGAARGLFNMYDVDGDELD